MEKVQNSTGGSCCAAFKGQRISNTSPSARVSRMLRFGIVALIAGAAFMLCASVGSLYMWKFSDKNVYNVRYSVNINREVREGSVEIDSDSNLQRFQTGSGAREAVEIHDFQIGITGIRFVEGDKCYIKSHTKANLLLMGAHNKDTLMFDLTDKLMPVRFDEESLLWVAAKQPLRNTTFLSNRILDLCGELPIFWLQPMHLEDGVRKKGGMRRAKRQLDMQKIKASTEERDLVSHRDQEAVDEGQSAVGSGYNPENPYHRSGEAREEGTMTFDSMLDHQGICCSECQRSYTHCQRVCEPLRGYWPWPYNYRGCQVACRVILPCRWWVARILGVL